MLDVLSLEGCYPSVHQTPPSVLRQAPGLATQRVDSLTLCRLWGPAWWILGSEGPWLRGPAWLTQRVFDTEGPRREARDMIGGLTKGRKSPIETAHEQQGRMGTIMGTYFNRIEGVRGSEEL